MCNYGKMLMDLHLLYFFSNSGQVILPRSSSSTMEVYQWTSGTHPFKHSLANLFVLLLSLLYNALPSPYRGNWEIARQDLDDAQIITMVPTERDFMDSYEDYLPIRTRSGTLCCRTVAVIVSFWHQNWPSLMWFTLISFLMKIHHFDWIIEQFMALLVLRHTLPLMVGGNGEYSLALFSVRWMIITRQNLLSRYCSLTWCLLLCILIWK